MPDTTNERAQERAVEQLGLQNGRVCVGGRFEDGHLNVTAYGGACWRVSAEGIVTEASPNHSIDWSEET